jgi:2-polyprenyl-3-methyl-5-hydroxy-6-metoxy-1,4-benzoquinol methylase
MNYNPHYEQRLHESRLYWNSEAVSFDSQPDHGLHDPSVLAAWTRLLKTSLKPNKAAILDVGCGTGSLSIVLANLGYEVTGIDLSPEMISLAEAKAMALHRPIQFCVMDAAYPQFPPQQFDAVLCRHVLWALPQMDKVLRRWIRLLKPGGRLLLIEGFWYTGEGLHAEQIIRALPDSLTNISIRYLSSQPDLWGHDVDDERYAIIADLPTQHTTP